MTKDEILTLLLKGDYHTIDDLRYNRKKGIMMSKEEFSCFLDVKDRLVEENSEFFEPIALRSFNSKHIFYVNNVEFLSAHSEYLRILLSDYETKHSLLFNRNIEDLTMARLFSEIEGSLNIENVPTTRKRIAEICEKNVLEDRNDRIVKNMIDAVRFLVSEEPEFNKDNLRKLYGILSQDCLEDDKCLLPNAYYRHDKVYIDVYEGADPAIVGECMDSMFSFANDPESIEKYGILLPYICQYYILYVHPYFDYNGRTARMVSFWLSYINNIAGAPIFMSEAINENKGDYYRAITDTRNTNNDLTYFLLYILKTSVQYSLIYKNLEEIKNELSRSGDSLTSTEWGYVKKILIHNPDGFFNYRMFTEYLHSNITKQGAIKILDNLTEYEILTKSKNRKNETIYKFNSDLITYRLN